MTQRLDVVMPVTLNAQGGGTVQVQVPWGQQWRVTGVAVSLNTGARPYPTFALYRGSAQAANIVAATYSGQSDVAAGNELLFAGETLVGVWTGGTVGAVATCHVMGEIEAQ